MNQIGLMKDERKVVFHFTITNHFIHLGNCFMFPRCNSSYICNINVIYTLFDYVYIFGNWHPLFPA